MQDQSYLTAISRKTLSAPARYLLESGRLLKSHRILDYGCGRGDDVKRLSVREFDIDGYDPYWRYKGIEGKYDIILCTYVFNVVGESERHKILIEMSDLLKENGKIYITVRRDIKKYVRNKNGTKQYPVELPFKIVKENSSFCIYEV